MMLPKQPRAKADCESIRCSSQPASSLRPRSTAAVALLGVLASGWSVWAGAVDFNESFFGTLGYAASNRPYAFQRSIDNHGSFYRDSILGGQVDASLSPQWSATVQLTLSPSLTRDKTWALQDAWGFVSWRPDNDWLLRLGKQRAPLFLNSENRDVAQTYAQARLPAEVYALSPTTDFTGLSVLRTWLKGNDDLGAELYGGRAHVTDRAYASDLGPVFTSVRADLVGMTLSWHTPQSLLRAGYIHANVARDDGQPFDRSFALVGQGPLSYYQVSNALPGPGVPTTSEVVNNVMLLGLDTELWPDWRLVLEGARSVQLRTSLGDDTAGASVTLLHNIGRWTPYAGLAALHTLGAERELQAALLNAAGSGSGALAVAQRIAGQSMPVYEQATLSVGSSLALDAHSRVKVEWAQTRVGQGSAMIDDPMGSHIAHTRVQVYSMSYSFAY